MRSVTSLRDKQKELTRQQLIESALEVFSTKGFTNTSVEDLTRSAGAGRATFYLHFASKLDILINASAVASEVTPDLYAALDKALADGSRRDFDAALDAIVSWFESHSGLLQAVSEAAMEDASTLIPKAHRLLDAYFEAMPYVRSQWPASKQQQAKVRLHLFVLQLERFFQTYAATGQWSFPRDVLIGVLADMWSTDFLPPKASPRPVRKKTRVSST